jgi:hypothetical protein
MSALPPKVAAENANYDPGGLLLITEYPIHFTSRDCGYTSPMKSALPISSPLWRSMS